VASALSSLLPISTNAVSVTGTYSPSYGLVHSEWSHGARLLTVWASTLRLFLVVASRAVTVLHCLLLLPPRSRSRPIPHRVPSRSLRVADTSTLNDTRVEASEIRQGIPSLRALDDVKLVLAGTYVEVADFHSNRHGHTEATSQVPSGCPEIHCSCNW
jgi:hypothetical protein